MQKLVDTNNQNNLLKQEVENLNKKAEEKDHIVEQLFDVIDTLKQELEQLHSKMDSVLAQKEALPNVDAKPFIVETCNQSNISPSNQQEITFP